MVPQPLPPDARSDTGYCCTAHRVAAYRDRLRIAKAAHLEHFGIATPGRAASPHPSVDVSAPVPRPQPIEPEDDIDRRPRDPDPPE